MISDSISKLESPKILIECNKEDHKLVKQIISELPDKKITVNLSDKPLEIMGGIKASTADKSMTLDNTLESHMEKLKPLIRKDIVQLLRGE